MAAAAGPALKCSRTRLSSIVSGFGERRVEEGEVLRVNDLRVAFDVNGSPVEVVKGISFRVCSGAVTAVVGESGSGKSVTAQAVMRILPKNGTIIGGSIEFQP